MTLPSRRISRGAAALAGASSVLAYPFLPKRVATHFDEEGRPDGYSSRTATAVQFPVLMLGLQLVNDRLAAWPGGGDRENRGSGVEAREEAVAVIELGLLAGHLAVLTNAAGLPVNMKAVNRGVVGVLMLTLGNLLPKLPRNGLMGIRTPWTLADPVVWERTHRLGGYLLAGAGALTLGSALAGKRATRVPQISILSTVGLSAAYSFVVYTRRHRSTR